MGHLLLMRFCLSVCSFFSTPPSFSSLLFVLLFYFCCPHSFFFVLPLFSTPYLPLFSSFSLPLCFSSLFSSLYFSFLFFPSLVARASAGSAVQLIRVGALSPMPSCLGIGGHTNGSRQGQVHWGPKSRKAVSGQFGSDSSYTANTVAEQVVKNR